MDYLQQFELIKQGAEAKLYKGQYLGMPAIIKERFRKKYRHPLLDENIGKERLKAETRGILRSKIIGVRTPTIYLVDPQKRYIIMEYINGTLVKDLINDVLSNEHSRSLLSVVIRQIGEAIGKLHRANIIHGDLTTSNMIFMSDAYLYLIDFGLSFVRNSFEDKGVDLYVLERAILSTHPDSEELFQNILDSYVKVYDKGAKEVLIKYKEIKARGRKRTMIG